MLCIVRLKINRIPIKHKIHNLFWLFSSWSITLQKFVATKLFVSQILRIFILNSFYINQLYHTAKFFPHEVVDLERTFYYLEQQIATDFATWEVRYVLLLWLSIIILVPFDLKIIDSSAENQQTLAARMIKEAKNYLRDSGKSREAAALFLAKLLTRPDMDHELVEFLKWANQTLVDATDHYMVNTIVLNIFVMD